MRRVLVLIAVAAVLVGVLPGTVAAARPTVTNDDATVVSCQVTTGAGTATVFAELNDQFGPFGDLAFWATPADPSFDPPTLVSVQADITGSETSIDATYDLAEFDPSTDPPFGAPAGEAVLAADLSPDGEPLVLSERARNGNQWERVNGTVQALAVSGTLTMPGAEPASLTDCFAETRHLTIRRSQPASLVLRFSQFFVECFWETPTSFVSLTGSLEDFGSFADVFVADASGEYVGFSEGGLSRTAFDTTFDLQAPDGGPVVGTATVAATLTASGIRVRSTEDDGVATIKSIFEAYAADGTLEVSTPGGDQSLALDDEHCIAGDRQTFVHQVTPGGPKGRPLSNDTPDGALALRIGRTAKVVTSATAFDPEEPCTVDDGEGGTFELPINHTAWWTFVGNGNEMTVDTNGSYIDTIVGVYTLDGGTFTQIGCVDDVFDPTFTLNSRVTVPTVAGATYYVQAGGFGGSSGRLHIVVR